MPSVIDPRLLDTLPDFLILVRQDGRIEFANRQAENLFGYSADERTQLPIEMLFLQRYRDQRTISLTR